jgi:hypothetical protein
MLSDDTVITQDEQKIFAGNTQALLEWQAEKSFKAGVKEVVDWVKSTRLTPLPEKPSKGITFFSNAEFQAKIKEWDLS